jgi:predicted signal transduction protein with EAL and GGDEF domain
MRVQFEGTHRDEATMRVMKRVFLLMFVTPMAITTAVIVAVLLIAHFRLGASSPGVVKLASTAMSYWIPLLVILLFVLPSLFGAWLLMIAARVAKRHGLAFSAYMALTPPEKAALRASASPQATPPP